MRMPGKIWRHCQSFQPKPSRNIHHSLTGKPGPPQAEAMACTEHWVLSRQFKRITFFFQITCIPCKCSLCGFGLQTVKMTLLFTHKKNTKDDKTFYLESFKHENWNTFSKYAGKLDTKPTLHSNSLIFWRNHWWVKVSFFKKRWRGKEEVMIGLRQMPIVSQITPGVWLEELPEM